MEPLTLATNDERSARVVLAAVSTPGDPMTGRVLAAAGAVETMRLLSDDGLVPALDSIEARLWRERLRPRTDVGVVRRAVDRVEDTELRILIPGDDDYPSRLGDLGHRAPYVLWAKGDVELLRPFAQTFTITGTSGATPYGRQIATELASDLLADNSVLVAGGASGIDASVHRAALNHGGGTIAVVPGELADLGWSGKDQRLHEIADRGLLLSETPPGTMPTRERFLARLRIEAALSGSVTVVEASHQSASLAIVDWAQELGLPVGMVPGPVTSAASEAPNELIRDRMAAAILDAGDLMNVHYAPPDPPKRPLAAGSPTHMPTRHPDWNRSL